MVVLLLEVGLALTVLPWSSFWEQNYFVQTVPLVGGVVMNHFVRGAVSGLGVVNIGTAVCELVAMMVAKAHRPGDTRPLPPRTD